MKYQEMSGCVFTFCRSYLLSFQTRYSERKLDMSIARVIRIHNTDVYKQRIKLYKKDNSKNDILYKQKVVKYVMSNFKKSMNYQKPKYINL